MGGGGPKSIIFLRPAFGKGQEGTVARAPESPPPALRCLWWGGPGMAHRLLLSAQHGTLGSGRSSDKGPSWSTRSLGARCRNSIASCPEEQPHVGNYRLLRTIGKGNFAKVKLARHILTGREVSACDRGLGWMAGLGSSRGVRSELVLAGLLTLGNSPTCSEFKVGFVLFGDRGLCT